MALNARNATATDFERAAWRKAGSFLGWLAASVLAVFFLSWWWAIVPAIVAIHSAAQAITAMIAVRQLRAGTFPVPNPNNGISPDGKTLSQRAEIVRQRMAQHGISTQDFARYDTANPDDARRVFAEFESDDPALWARAAERIKGALARLPAP